MATTSIMQRRAPAPTIFDAHGRPAARKYSFGGYNGSGDYEAARNNRERTLYNSWSALRPRTETEMLPFTDRLQIISYLRQSIRNNPVMASLAYRYALAIGSPGVRVLSPNGQKNDVAERKLERRLRTIMHGTRWSWHRLHKIISTEELIAGEVFAVEVEDGIQLIPSELCGSPTRAPENEVQGIGYDGSGAIIYYRFGRRIPTARGAANTRITYELAEGATLVDASRVHHLGAPSRIEERRYSPKLAPVISMVQHLDDIIKAKVTTVKNQSAFSLFFTKNFDPAMFGETMGTAVETQADALLDQATARSDYTDIKNGTIYYGEVGEDLKLIEPNLNAQDFGAFALLLLDQICAPVGLFPEEVIVGYRNSNYSSARADRNRMKDVLTDARQERAHFCDAVVSRELEDLAPVGGQPLADISDVYYAWPIVREIDETKHILAQVAAMNAQIKSADQIAAENGNYGDATDAQIVRGAARIARLIKAEAGNITDPAAQAAIEVTADEIIAQMPRGATAAQSQVALANVSSVPDAADAPPVEIS